MFMDEGETINLHYHEYVEQKWIILTWTLDLQNWLKVTAYLATNGHSVGEVEELLSNEGGRGRKFLQTLILHIRF